MPARYWSTGFGATPPLIAEASCLEGFFFILQFTWGEWSSAAVTSPPSRASVPPPTPVRPCAQVSPPDPSPPKMTPSATREPDLPQSPPFSRPSPLLH